MARRSGSWIDSIKDARSAMADFETADGRMASAGAQCAFCGHRNPSAAKYCNECAADLQLALCPSCSAVNRRDMPQCHKCGASLEVTPEDNATLPAIVETTADASPPLPPPPPRRRGVAIALVASVCAIAAVYALYQAGAISPSALPAVAPGIESHARGNEAPPPEAAPAEPTPAAVAQPVPPARADTTEQRMDGSPTQPVATPKDATEPAQDRSTPGPSTSGCTDAVAALALCDRTPPK